MRDRIKSFLKEKDICVLATVQEGRPHCSLMAYMTDERAEWIFMVTHRNTTKYANLLENPSVSLLVDNRCERMPAQRSEIQALTVHGTYHPLDDRERKRQILDEILERHPHMRDFLEHPEAEIIRVRPISFLYLDGISDAHYETA